MSAEAARAELLLRRQRAAHLRFGAPALKTRAERLQRAGALLREFVPAMAQAISDDFGHRAPQETLLLEASGASAAVRYALRHLPRWMAPERRRVGMQFITSKARVRREPLGVVGIISPWNYPLMLALSPLVDALAAGNRILLKPSEATPRFSELLQKAVARHFSEEEVAVVLGGPDVGAAFAALPFDHLLFTGSTAIGRKVACAAAEKLVPVTLELGGKSPAILCPSADRGKATRAIAYGRFVNAGQTCIAPDYVLAPASIAEKVAEALAAESRRLYPDLDRDYTTLINDRSYQRLKLAVDEAANGGAKVFTHGGTASPGRRLFPPTVVLDPPVDSLLMREEIFGPVLPVVGYDTLDEALTFVANKPHPLALYIFAKARKEIDHVLSRSQSGGVSINTVLLHIAQEALPFGGVGESGTGAYHGKAGFDRFTHERAVFELGAIDPIPIIAPPYKRK